MQLVNMDVDQFGTNQRCQLGPFSPGLNAICGPKGSGKTTLLSWLRQIAAENFATNYPAVPHLAVSRQTPITGAVDFRNRTTTFSAVSDRNGRIEFARSRSAHAESAGNFLTAMQRDVFSSLAAASGSSDTEAALEDLARRLQLESSEPRQPVASEQQRYLLDQEQELARRLDSLVNLKTTRAELLHQRSELESELQTAQTDSIALRRASDFAILEQKRLSERYEAIEADLQATQAELDQLDQQIARVRAQLKLHTGSPGSVDVGNSYRQQLQELDDRLNRWRQTLRDLKSHREKIEYNATDARLDKQIGEQLASTKHSDPRAALRALEAQILNTRSQLELLVNRYGEQELTTQVSAQGDYVVRRDADGQTRIAYSQAANVVDYGSLPDTLRIMQRDLHEVCQQLARHEATTATETFKQQSQQLRRCETELLQSVEKLIEERAQLLRRIANEQNLSVEQLTLAFGEWCQCQDHPNLQEWLLHNESSTKNIACGTDRQAIIAELEQLETRRRHSHARVEDCRRQLNDAEFSRRGDATPATLPAGRTTVEISRDLDAVNAELQGMDEHDRLAADLEQVRQKLRELPTTERRTSSSFRATVNRHIVGLLGPSGRQSLQPSARGRFETLRRYDTIDGVVVEQPLRAAEYHVPNAIVRVAMRLAIAEATAARGEPVSLIIDDTLDDLSPEIQKAAVSYLAKISVGKQQVVLLTSDEHIASLVRDHLGFVDYIRTNHNSHSLDINRQLAAFANDDEAARWYQPVGPKPRTTEPRREYYLNDRSPIEDLPSTDATSAARCRALGIDRIGDLLDVDPQWLADNLRVDGVETSTVTRWQAEARLLCSVRKLLPFDARVLVGAGIRTPQQLSDMHPSHLLERVERFLATDRGRSILKSGSSYELSRIKSWITAAKNGSSRYQRTSLEDDYDAGAIHGNDRTSGSSREGSRSDAHNGFDRDYERRSRNGRSEGRSQGRASSSGERNGSSIERTRTSGERTTRQSRGVYPTISRGGERSYTDREREEREPRERRQPRSRRTRTRPPEREYDRRDRVSSETVRLAKTEPENDAVRLKFYLELSSPVVDAPSIGPRMATRLEKYGIVSVDQLLAANAETLADKLNLRRVDAATIQGWQEQARLVCRIPNLRGHDAQLLVACDMTSPEELAAMDADTVLTQVLAVAQSTEGQRILRGSKEPDLEEVNDWISWAKSCRSLNAA